MVLNRLYILSAFFIVLNSVAQEEMLLSGVTPSVDQEVLLKKVENLEKTVEAAMRGAKKGVFGYFESIMTNRTRALCILGLSGVAVVSGYMYYLRYRNARELHEAIDMEVDSGKKMNQAVNKGAKEVEDATTTAENEFNEQKKKHEAYVKTVEEGNQKLDENFGNVQGQLENQYKQMEENITQFNSEVSRFLDDQKTELLKKTTELQTELKALISSNAVSHQKRMQEFDTFQYSCKDVANHHQARLSAICQGIDSLKQDNEKYSQTLSEELEKYEEELKNKELTQDELNKVEIELQKLTNQIKTMNQQLDTIDTQILTSQEKVNETKEMLHNIGQKVISKQGEKLLSLTAQHVSFGNKNPLLTWK